MTSSARSTGKWFASCGELQLESAQSLREGSQRCGLLILAAGFEERARVLFDRVWSHVVGAKVVLIAYDFTINENDLAYSYIKQGIASVGAVDNLNEVVIDPRRPNLFGSNLSSALNAIYVDPTSEVWLDISGLPMWAICDALRSVRLRFGLARIRVFYTEARMYFPTKEEYRESAVFRESKKLPANLPESLTSEMSENLILESFSGVSLREHTTCLILFAGYEKHRSLGVIEEINPSRLLIIYGRPGRKQLAWRLEMSRKLHETLITERATAEETVSTLVIGESLDVIDQYYSALYDNHNICVSPVCSKMQAVASYLVWERYRDIQLVFPLPVKYLPNRFSEGYGRTFSVFLPPSPGIPGV